MKLVFEMANQALVELFIKSVYFMEWSDGGVPLQEALDRFMKAEANQKNGQASGLGCCGYDKDDFISLQLTAIKMCQKRQRLMQYESGGS